MDLCVMNSAFELKNEYITTWLHPCSKKWHFIDYILTRNRDTRDLLCTSDMCCWNHNRLVRAKVNFL